MSEKIINGITIVDFNEHVVTGRYKPRTSPEDSSAIEVVEMANARLAHTKVDGGDLDGRIAVFSRLITRAELSERQYDFDMDPEAFASDHIQTLSS